VKLTTLPVQHHVVNKSTPHRQLHSVPVRIELTYYDNRLCLCKQTSSHYSPKFSQDQTGIVLDSTCNTPLEPGDVIGKFSARNFRLRSRRRAASGGVRNHRMVNAGYFYGSPCADKPAASNVRPIDMERLVRVNLNQLLIGRM